MMKLILVCIVSMNIFLSCDSKQESHQDCEYVLTGNDCIYSSKKHCAFTGMVQWNSDIYLCFREGGKHVPGVIDEYGKIQILKYTKDEWVAFKTIEYAGFDLRDPKLYVTKDNELMLMCGYSKLVDNKLQKCGTLISFYKNNEFTDLMPIKHDVEHECWLWHIVWEGDKAYGVAYMEGFDAVLLTSYDGINWNTITSFELNGVVTEAAIQIVDKKMKVVVRRDGGTALIGDSRFPFQSWKWSDSFIRLESPVLVPFQSNEYFLCGRYVGDKKKETVLYILTEDNSLKKLFVLNSGQSGDVAYPGILDLGNELWISYYAGDYNQADVFLARIGRKCL